MLAPCLVKCFPLGFLSKASVFPLLCSEEPSNSAHSCKYLSSRICLCWTWSTREWSKPEISNWLLCAAVLKLQFYFERTCPSEGKLFCGWCADLYEGRIKASLFFSQVQKKVHGESSSGNSSKWTPGSKILYLMGQYMQWKPGVFIKKLEVVIGLKPSSPFVNQFGIILNENEGNHMRNVLNGSKLLTWIQK